MTFDYDCMTCGACCDYSADWPELVTEVDWSEAGPPEHLRTEDGFMRATGNRCDALHGLVGEAVRCTIYEHRPSPCRNCEAGSQSCHIARRAHGLPTPDDVGTMDFF